MSSERESGVSVGGELKPYHWGKSDARFFVAQDDVDRNGWGVFEMGADVPILFWCASEDDATAAALRLNHLNEERLSLRRTQIDTKTAANRHTESQ